MIIRKLLYSTFRWIIKNISSIIVLFLIIIIIALIDVYGTDISSNSVNVIVAVAAGVSTYFLFLTVRESKKSNAIQIYEPEFSHLAQQVSDQENKSKEELFATNKQHMSTILNYPIKKIEEILYGEFIIELPQLLLAIQRSTTYEGCLALLKDNETADLPNNIFLQKDAMQMASILKIIRHTLVLMNHFLMNQYSIYHSIDNSLMIKEQKEILMKRMKKTSKEYFLLTDLIFKNEGVGKIINEFQFFEYLMKRQIHRYNNNFGASILSITSAIEEIMETYPD